MQTLDWQEQERRATEIRQILERTLNLAQTEGLMEWVGNGWQYTGDEQTLFYNPDSDHLSVFSHDRSWQLNWHEDLFIADASTQISDRQFEEFKQLEQWLDGQEKAFQPSSESKLVTTAARLFEKFVADGETAFKRAIDSTEHTYRVEVDEVTYWISRDDETGVYSLQREDDQLLQDDDEVVWQEIDQWLDELDYAYAQVPETFVEAPYWEQQALWANQLLPQAEYIFAFQEAQEGLTFDPFEQKYLIDSGDYQIGYTPITDVFWIDRDGERILSAKAYNLHRDNELGYPELHDLGEIEVGDLARFWEWSNWLRLKAEQMQSLPDWEATFNRLWNEADIQLEQFTWNPSPFEQIDDFEMDR